jgi:hypothetical protein
MSATEPWRITALDVSATACRPKTWSLHGGAMVADSFSGEHTGRFIGRSSILFSSSHLSLDPLLAPWLALELRARRLVDCSAGRSFSDC